MPYEFTRKGELAHLDLIGALSKDDLEDLLPKLTPPDQLETAPSMLVLIDATQLKKVDLGARKTLVELSRRRTARKIAIVGLAPYVRVLANFISKAAGRGNMQLFDAEDKAMAWLED